MGMTNEQIDKVIQDFCTNTDNELALQKNLNDFSRSVTSSLLQQINTGEAVLASFGDKKFAFKATEAVYENGAKIYKISVMDMEKFQSYFKMGALDSLKPKTATFQYEPEYTLEEEMANALTLLLFDVFGIELSASDIGDEGMVKF